MAISGGRMTAHLRRGMRVATWFELQRICGDETLVEYFRRMRG